MEFLLLMKSMLDPHYEPLYMIMVAVKFRINTKRVVLEIGQISQGELYLPTLLVLLCTRFVTICANCRTTHLSH